MNGFLRGGIMDFKIVDDVNISKEELDYYENHDFGEEIRKGLEDGTAIVSEGQGGAGETGR